MQCQLIPLLLYELTMFLKLCTVFVLCWLSWFPTYSKDST